ncbi:PREDICTED: clathrin interactor EPSIN 1-like [Nelumbo nucifera]|uniref:Clathrin interactor EPSIN 1-like n=2 Tax=Nelumbo nucifera TaxID=4432 RepID=A0A1U8PYN9_NELNU|nr:PREDICTED: clathrin interactor EPSIN 1-like [Nelumbo nucifera]DAD44516.1 TPA_asm: hypothetical protein HUJ06_002746 [Nelumbo nucifera]
MDFMKVIDQTIRGIKREVNLKILKVAEIEQKVLDATSDEPWGPHGSVLAEIAQATKKFTECQMIMNVLWTRLSDTGRNWRHVYKALAVIEYLVAHGSERALDDIIEHTFQIASLSGFEYVEPNGKDMGINVRKRSETIVTLLNDKDKIQGVRNKAAANRDKYFGLSSSGITYKSSSTSYDSSSFNHNDRYGGPSNRKEGEMSKDTYRDKERLEKEYGKGSHDKPHSGIANDDKGTNMKKGTSCYGSKGQDAPPPSNSSSDSKLSHSDDNYGPLPSQSSNAPLSYPDDDFDDFDPRGTSTTGLAATSVKQVDLFGENLIDLMDTPTSGPTETGTVNNNATEEVDLFSNATFVSATPHVEAGAVPQFQANFDPFPSQPSFSSAFSSTVDLFSAPGPDSQMESRTLQSEPENSNSIDPFAAMPLNSFDGSNLSGEFTFHSAQLSTESTINSANDGDLNKLNQDQEPPIESKPPPKKDTFQVKSEIWADSLSRGLIDLNISAPKMVSLAEVGIVGDLSDGLDEKEKGSPTSAYMGKAMGVGSGLGISGFTSTGTAGNDIFSSLDQQQFGSFK